MKGQFIFLDDIRTPLGTTHVQIPNYPYTIARDFNEFGQAVVDYYNVTRKAPEFVTFDHDLSDFAHLENQDTSDEKTGAHCARWLCNFCAENDLDFPDYMVHSMNPIGKENIVSIIESFKKSR